MADLQVESSVMLKRNSKILVNVEEAHQDLLLVSYAIESRLFQGVLLDSTRRFLPCRIPEISSNNISSPKNEDKISEEDKLFYNIRQRFTYFQEKPSHITSFHPPKKFSKAKNQKMTVRLRPRQVLCSKCRSICNENSENVNNCPNKNKKPEPPDSSPRPLFSENRRDNHLPNHSPPTKLCPSFVQRIPRLQTSPIQNNSLHGNSPAILRSEDLWFKGTEEQKGIFENVPDEETDKQMVLRKKRSVGSMEDLWDETVFEEGSKKAKTTPVIKISFGSQGEGTVLKIPSKVQLCSESETEEKPTTPSVSKATRKALKKAKKEARKKVSIDSPKRHKSPSPPEITFKKHKHKVKHKKKHKGEKNDDEIKDKCLKQKLSINLRRLTSTTYEKAESSDSSASSEDGSDFPEVKQPKDITSTCTTDDGTSLAIGDIVWGKVHGFPWWPGKVSNLFSKKENNSWEACVVWYGSSTSTMMPCDQLSPFLSTFKERYNRRKRSAGYKEAIRLATTDASASNPAVVPEALLSD